MQLTAGQGANLLGLGFPLSGSISGKTFIATALNGDLLTTSSQNSGKASYPANSTVLFSVTSQLGTPPVTGAEIDQATWTPSTPADAATVNFDLSKASIFIPAAMAGNRALTLSNAPAATPWVRPFTVVLTQDSTGSRTISSWFSGFTIRWAGGTAPTLTTTASKSDVFTFIQIGATTLLGFTTGLNL